jgi:hypothetical protein
MTYTDVTCLACGGALEWEEDHYFCKEHGRMREVQMPETILASFLSIRYLVRHE